MGNQHQGMDMGPYWKAEEEAKAAKRGMWVLGDKYVSPEGVEEDARELGCPPICAHIDHIRMCQPPISALMIPNVIDAITISMINAGMVAIAHFTMRTTIDRNGILISVTMTFPQSVDILVSSLSPCHWLIFFLKFPEQ